MRYVTDRLREPSTHAALCALVASAAYVWPQYSAAILGVSGLFGLGGVAISERK